MASKRNPTHVVNGEEYSRAQSGKEISKSTLAQRAQRREREQILKQSTAAQSGKEISKSTLAQRAQRERERILKQSTAQLSEQRLPSGKENAQDCDRDASKLKRINILVAQSGSGSGSVDMWKLLRDGMPVRIKDDEVEEEVAGEVSRKPKVINNVSTNIKFEEVDRR